MRRAIAISLLVFFGWMLAAPLVVTDPEANLPPCCRRHGKHHCAMMDLAQRIGTGPAFTTVSERCPYRQTANTATRGSGWQPENAPLLFAGFDRQPAPVERPCVLRRGATGRSHLKRGPPASSRMA